MGVMSAVATEVGAFSEAILAGRSGVRAIRSFDASTYRSRIAGEIAGFDPLQYFDGKTVDRVDRFAQLAVAAAEPALRESGLAEDERTRGGSGVVLGTGLGGIASNDDQFKTMYTRGHQRVSPWAIPMIMYNAAASHLSMRFGLRGPNVTVTTACSSSSNAIGQAYRAIKDGYADIMVAGGSDAPVTPGILAAWCALRALSMRNDDPESACRPFSADRDGLVLAEGAGMLVLESLESAARRSAPIHGEIAGYGSNNDGFHITQPSAASEATVMRDTLEEADLPAAAIDYVSAHGTGTSLNDRTETLALGQIFGDRLAGVPVSSLKSMLGHHMGACGALQVIATLLMMAAGTVHPTINYRVRDPECNLDCVPNEARRADVHAALVNSFGFGGNNAVLAIKRWDDR
jgi:3-oxoacyl-[acyl-carrier-protein] synthase II